MSRALYTGKAHTSGERAHLLSPYSKATRRNIGVALSIA